MSVAPEEIVEDLHLGESLVCLYYTPMTQEANRRGGPTEREFGLAILLFHHRNPDVT